MAKQRTLKSSRIELFERKPNCK